MAKRLRFVVSLPNSNSYQQEQAAAAKATAQQLGAEVQVLDADNNAVNQSQQILAILQSKSEPQPDAVIVEPLTTTGLGRVAEAAVKAGTGWVVLNSDVDYLAALRERSSVPAFAVTRDHTEIGRIQGRQFSALLPNGGNVLYIQGPANNAAAIQRTHGLESSKPANIQLKQLRSQWSEEDANRTVSAWLRLSTNRAASIDLVGCQYDGIAMGARKAFDHHTDSAERERWLSLPLTGVDGLPREGQAWVQQGILAATVVALTTTELGMKMAAHAIATGNQPPERTLVQLESYPSLQQLADRARSQVTKG